MILVFQIWVLADFSGFMTITFRLFYFLVEYFIARTPMESSPNKKHELLIICGSSPQTTCDDTPSDENSWQSGWENSKNNSLIQSSWNCFDISQFFTEIVYVFQEPRNIPVAPRWTPISGNLLQPPSSFWSGLSIMSFFLRSWKRPHFRTSTRVELSDEVVPRSVVK